jgi:hypothetical protein
MIGLVVATVRQQQNPSRKHVRTQVAAGGAAVGGALLLLSAPEL